MSEGFEVRTHDGFAGVFAARSLVKGEEVFRLAGDVRRRPSKYSIQIGVDRHVEPRNGGNGAPASMQESWRFLNHSCDPNLEVAFDTMRLVARRDVAVGEELSFNYLTTEWDMATPFECHCRAEGCFRYIGGFKRLTLNQRKRLINHVAPHIKSCVEEEARPRIAAAR